MTPPSVYVLRDDRPEPTCSCGSGPLTRWPHSSWCDIVRDRGGVYYYAGRDLEGHWFMPGQHNAARYSYRDAVRLRRELKTPRRLTIEKVAA